MFFQKIWNVPIIVIMPTTIVGHSDFYKKRRLNEYAKSVLKELGNISVREKGTRRYNGATFDFNPFNAASGEYDRLEEFEQASGDKLFRRYFCGL